MSLKTPTTRLTEEQASALAAYDRTVSLAAGAGCGKTFVLTERFLAYLDPRILEPVAELHELVAITFTDAAAREMRQRIRRRCYSRLHEATEPEEQAAWRRLIRAMDGARISTIHSFCTALLRSHAAEAKVDPRFDLLDPPAAELLRLQTLDDRLRHLLLAGDERVIRLATRLELRRLRDNIANLLGNNVWPVVERWSDATPEELVDVWRDFYAQELVPHEVATLLEAESIVRFEAMCRTAEVSRPSFPEHVQRVSQALGQLAEGDAHAAVDELHQLARVHGVCTKKEWAEPSRFEEFKQTCTTVRNLLSASPLQRQLQQDRLLEAAATGLDLLHVVADVATCYETAKQDQNVLEFDDLLVRAHRLLSDPAHRSLRQSLVGNTRLLMVDEFQDTDPLQVAIVKAFCGDDWSRQGLFVVGDHKQSIYRFRGAEPRVSSELRASLDSKSRLSLTTNFRSQPAILDFVNALFGEAFAEEYEPLRAHRPQTTATPAIEFVWALGEAEPSDEFSARHTPKQRARAREARFIAKRLAQLIDSGEPIVSEPNVGGEESSLRPLEPGDVAILMRSLSDVAIYEDALRQHGFDYYLAGGHAFYAQQEIYDVLHLLRAITSEADDLSLAGALRSPLFALQDETLYWLVERHGSLNAGLLAEELPSQLVPQERAKVERAAATLRQLRESKDRMLVSPLLNEALELTGYDAALLCEFLGERKLANVHKLLEQARALDRTRPGDLAGFITQLSEFVVRAPKEPLAATRAEGNVIRIMTIHNTKGLEFPLVVVPDLGRRTRSSDFDPVFDEQLGPLVPAATAKTTVGLDLFRAAQRDENLEERKRIFYVACTRAADYLMLSSSIEDLGHPKSDWLQLLAKRFDLGSGRCLANLPESYGLPEVRVIVDEPVVDRKLPGKSHRANLNKVVRKAAELAASDQGMTPGSVQTIQAKGIARRRFSFSRLSGQLKTEHTIIATDEGSAATKSSLDPRGLGTLIHAALERVDFTAEDNDVEGLCRFLAPLHLPSDWLEAATTATRLVDGFLRHSRAAEIAQAHTVHREVEFVLPWPPTVEGSADRYLHGYIDCLYQDAAGGWHLLDYKSNQVSVNGVPNAAKAYQLQMYVYWLACQQALGVKPVEGVIHFLQPQTEFVCEFDDSQSAEWAAQITRMIEKERSGATLSSDRRTEAL